MKRGTNPKKTFLFIILAASLMIISDFVLDGLAPGTLFSDNSIIAHLLQTETKEKQEDQLSTENEQQQEAKKIILPQKMGPPEPYGPLTDTQTPQTYGPQQQLQESALPPPYKQPETIKGHPKIAIIIDDMGLDHVRNRAIMNLDAPLTLAFLPYAPDVKRLVKEAKNSNHEIMIHMPMEPMDSTLSTGSIALYQKMTAEEIKTELGKAFNAFDGYIGMNNHMGSRLTQNPQIMTQVMQMLKEKSLYFIDSKTIENSIAYDVAKSYGLPTGKRDIFLDHKNTPEFVRQSLKDLESIANRRGYAIAIGHPRDATIKGLKEWLPEATKKGYTIVPVSELLQKPR